MFWSIIGLRKLPRMNNHVHLCYHNDIKVVQVLDYGKFKPTRCS